MTESKLLVPASLATYKTAVQAGADEIYLGALDFGARSYAENFDFEQLSEAVEYCHLRGTDVHLTLNTLIKEREFPHFFEIAKEARRIGVDAFIVQDLAAARALIDAGANVHASTQLTVHNVEGALFAQDFGFSRIVLSRELSEKELEKIVKSVSVETEIFVHGALCNCYSGQCLMSSIIGGRSANRGKCAQPCRLPYRLMCGDEEVKSGYFLNPYDLCLADVIGQVKRLGVTALKIEGRMKGREYVAAAASEYKKALDSGKCDLDMLKAAFCRGGKFTHGGFSGEKGKNIISLSSGNDNVYEIRDESKLSDLSEFTKENANLRKTAVSAEAYIMPGEKMSLALKLGAHTVTVYGDTASIAKSRPLSEDDAVKQISKTGDLPFYIENINVKTENAFAAVSALNALRRDAFNMLIKRLEKKSAELKIAMPAVPDKKKALPVRKNIWVSTPQQLKAVEKAEADNIFVPYDIWEDEKHYAVMPDIIRDISYYTDIINKKGIKKIAAGNLGLAKWALESGISVYITAAANVFSYASEKIWLDMGASGVQVSPELNAKELSFSGKSSAIAYGRLPLMKSANCPVYAAYGRCGEKGDFSLTDRKGENFKIKRDCRECVTYIYNSKPLYMADKLDEIRGVGGFDIMFTDETEEMCREVLILYEMKEKCPFDFTRGHFMRGVK